MEPTPSTTPWQLGALHHLGLTVADIERSIDFYRDILGLTLFRRRPRVDSDYVALQTGYPGVVLNVASFRVAPDSPQSLEIVQYMNQGGTAHGDGHEPVRHQPPLPHGERFAGVPCRSRAKGVRCKSEPVTITTGPNTGGLVVYFYDPDGYTLECLQMPESPKP